MFQTATKDFYYGFPVNEKTTVRALYKKLLALYPRGFRERLGESMQQTFHDLYQERKIEEGRLGFIFWTFAETGIGIFREHVLLIAEGATMKTTISNPRLAPVLSFILCVLPFMILEWQPGQMLLDPMHPPYYGLFCGFCRRSSLLS